MYIAPETNVKILRNVPLDESYEHTVHFGDSDSATGLIEAQTRFFNNYVAYNLTEYTYQRLQRGYIRVGIRAESLYNCNYLMYQNTAFGNKWFYAFILGIEYINNEVSQIQFEIDVMQTWMFDYKMERCFVSRMTPATDYIGENIIPESVDLGEFVYNKQNTGDNYRAFPESGLDRHHYVVLAICDTDSVTGNLYDGIYGGATLYAYDIHNISTGTNEIAALNTKIFEYRQKPEAILGIYYIPAWLLDNTFPADHLIPKTIQSFRRIIELAHPVSSWTIDGYLPKNCKLYTFPYNFFNFNNGQGDGLAIRYELFKGQTPKLMLSGTIVQPVSIMLKPFNYKGLEPATDPPTFGDELLDSEVLEVANYPICSWNTDAYKAWVAQNTIPISKKITAPLASVTAAQMLGVPVLPVAAMAAFSVLHNVQNALIQRYKASIEADIAKGNFNSGCPLMSQSRMYIFGGRMSVTYQYARVIDDYFTRFGYAQNRFMVPTKHNRPYWTYLKTIGCTIHGSIPKDDAVKICQIHDGGCLFLDPQFAEEGMDFTKDNSPGAGLRGYDPDKIHNGYNPDA